MHTDNNKAPQRQTSTIIPPTTFSTAKFTVAIGDAAHLVQLLKIAAEEILSDVSELRGAQELPHENHSFGDYHAQIEAIANHPILGDATNISVDISALESAKVHIRIAYGSLGHSTVGQMVEHVVSKLPEIEAVWTSNSNNDYCTYTRRYRNPGIWFRATQLPNIVPVTDHQHRS